MSTNALTGFIIEDDAHSLLAMASLLDELGIPYRRNTTGAGVLDQIERMARPPDFVLLNLDLPHGDAFAICRQLATDRHTAHLPVIAVMDCLTPDLLADTLACGFVACVEKPLPRRYFAAFLARVLASERDFTPPLHCPRDRRAGCPTV